MLYHIFASVPTVFTEYCVQHFPVEHVVLSVQGMTCTRCEKKLHRSLDMIPEILNIKTSLLLA